MKTTMKRHITALLCAALVMTGLEAGTAYAAGKKTPLKVGYRGTTISLIKDLGTSTGRDDTPKLSSIKKKWGNPKKGTSEGMTTYTWKKGKTSIEITDFDAGKDGVGSITVDIRDKNGSLCGVKVGMKRDAAVKKLQKQFGKKVVLVVKEGQQIDMKDDGSYIATGKATGEGETIYVYAGPYMPVSIELENGKVTALSFWRS